MSSKYYNTFTLGALVLLLLGLLYANFAMVAPYLLAVVMGAVLSVVFTPAYAKLLSWKIRVSWAALLVTIGVALLILVPVALFSIMAFNQAAELARSIPDPSQLSIEKLTEKVSNWKILKELIGNVASIEAELRKQALRVGSAAPGAIFKFFGGLPELVLQTVLGLLSLYFFLVDGNRFLVWLKDKVPLDPAVRGSILNSFRDTAVSAIVATMAAALVQTLIMVSGFLILGLPIAFLAGGATFIMAWVPLIGSSPIWLGAAIYFLSTGSPGKAVAMVGFGGLTALSDNVVHPWVLKGRSQMHPLVSLVAIFGGIQMFGIMGVFVGPILAALLIAVLEVWPLVAERFGILRTSTLISPNGAKQEDKTVPHPLADELSSKH